MPRRSKVGDPEQIRSRLVRLLSDFETKLRSDDLRQQVLDLVPAHHLLRDLGSSLKGLNTAASARDRILQYFQKYVGKTIASEELLVVSGIGEFARRVRELRVEFGWPIVSGVTLNAEFSEERDSRMEKLKPEDYILLSCRQDRDAAHRWNMANSIRKRKGSVKDKLLEYFKENVGKTLLGDELRYVAQEKKEWARRTRELRTQDGWRIATKNTGMPGLQIGEYCLQTLDQAEPHDRRIPDSVRVEVLERDHSACRWCLWTPAQRKDDDPRQFLELHHLEYHADGGSNSSVNLITLCNVHHDEVHRNKMTKVQLLNRIAYADDDGGGQKAAEK